MGDTIRIASHVDVVNGRAMVMRRPPDVSQERISELMEWGILELPSGQWHFVGNTVYSRPRVSGPVAWFDRDSMSGATASGRLYRLIGNPGESEAVKWLWQEWSTLQCIQQWRNVSEELWS